MAVIFFTLVGAVGCARVAPPALPPSIPETVVVTVTAPDAGWSLTVESVLELDGEVWILAQLRRTPGPAAQRLGPVRGEVAVALPSAKPRRVFVAGKTWAWTNEEPVEFVPSLAAISQRAGSARVLFASPPPILGSQPAR